MNMPEYDDLTHRIIGLAMRVPTRLGPGLLDSAYERCLCHEFDQTRSLMNGRSICGWTMTAFFSIVATEQT